MEKPLEPEGDLLDDLLDAWEMGRRCGAEPTVERLCVDHPHVAEEVGRRIERLRAWEDFQDQPQNEATGTPIVDAAPRPKIIDRYGIVELIGAGGMGVVYRARHLRMGRQVALKVLHGGLVNSPERVRRFRNEIMAAGRLIHPNIVTAFDAGEGDGVHFLAMELVEGEDFDRLVTRRGPLSAREAVAMCVQAARGLGHAHRAGIVHRDVKPRNLILASDGTVKILDLGLSRFRPGWEPVDEEGSSTVGFFGTAAYASPEQAFRAKAVDHRTDIYSLGCTLFFLLTGRPPYEAEDVMQLLLAHRDSPIPSLITACSGVPSALEVVHRRMQAKNPADRYQSMEEVVEALGDPRLHDPPVLRPTSTIPDPVPIPASTIDRIQGGEAVAATVHYSETGERRLPAEPREPSMKEASTNPLMGEPTPTTDHAVTGSLAPPLHNPDQARNRALDDARNLRRRRLAVAAVVVLLGGVGVWFLTRSHHAVVSNLTFESSTDSKADGGDEGGRRRLSRIIDLERAAVLESDQFDDPKRSGFGWGGHERKFEQGRLIVKAEESTAWGNSIYRFDNFVCELIGKSSGGIHDGWGLSIGKNFALDERTDYHGVEVLLNDRGELFVVPSRYVKDPTAETPPIGPITAESFLVGEFNSLAVMLTGPDKLAIFVNGSEVCRPVRLKPPLSPAEIMIATRRGVQGARVEFESIKICSARRTRPGIRPE